MLTGGGKDRASPEWHACCTSFSQGVTQTEVGGRRPRGPEPPDRPCTMPHQGVLGVVWSCLLARGQPVTIVRGALIHKWGHPTSMPTAGRGWGPATGWGNPRIFGTQTPDACAGVLLEGQAGGPHSQEEYRDPVISLLSPLAPRQPPTYLCLAPFNPEPRVCPRPRTGRCHWQRTGWALAVFRHRQQSKRAFVN